MGIKKGDTDDAELFPPLGDTPAEAEEATGEEEEEGWSVI